MQLGAGLQGRIAREHSSCTGRAGGALGMVWSAPPMGIIVHSRPKKPQEHGLEATPKHTYMEV